MALAEIGSRSTITAVNDGSNEANYCNLFYAPVRDQALRAARWNFARHFDTMVLFKAAPGTPENPSVVTTSGWLHNYPVPPWLYSYTLPSDFLFARSIIAQPDISTISPPIYPIAGSNLSQPRAPRAPFEIAIDPYDANGNPIIPQKKVLLTNQQNPILEYTYQATDETLWDSEFVMTQMFALASRLAIAIMGDKQLAQMKAAEANAMIQEARRQDANESVTVIDNIPDWLRIRGVGNPFSFYDFYYPYGPLFFAGT